MPFYFGILLYTDDIGMKKVFILILIALFAFPVLGYAATAPSSSKNSSIDASSTVVTTDITSPSLQGKTLAAKKKTVEGALRDIYIQLNTLSDQTQTAINQLNASGIVTTDAQTNILAANTSLTKAKSDIATFATIGTPSSKAAGAFALDMMKYTAATTETTLREAKKHLLDSLTSLKAALPDTHTGLATQ
jgi:hypothetical protein